MMMVRTFARFVALVLAVVAVALLLQPVVAPVRAQGGGDIPSFDAFLVFLSSTGVAGAVAILLSFAVDYIKPYNGLAPKNKRLVYFGLCLVVPIGAALLRAGLGYTPLTFDPLVWHALWNGAAAGGVGTLVHTYKLPTEEEIVEREAYIASLEAEAERAAKVLNHAKIARPPAL